MRVVIVGAIGSRIELTLSSFTTVSEEAMRVLTQHQQQMIQHSQQLKATTRGIEAGINHMKENISEELITGPNPSSQGSSNADGAESANEPGQSTSVPASKGLEVEVSWRPPFLCDGKCHCACHRPRQGRSPVILERMLGALFWVHSGLAVVRQACDTDLCQRKADVNIRIVYYFPSWWVRKTISFTCRTMPLDGPQVLLKSARIIDNGAPIFHLTQLRDLEGIKNLFYTGLASSLDIAHLRGRTPLHSAVIKCDIRLIEFFIKAHADKNAIDMAFCPSSIAWDIILSKSKDDATIDKLRELFNDPTSLEEYRFTQLHEAVLGIKYGDIREKINKDPKAIDYTDNRQNTPILWASRQGNLNHVKTLLACGANASAKNEAGEDAVIAAVVNTRLDCLEALLAARVPIQTDADGKTALHHACNLRGDVRFTQLLVQAGADVNQRDVLKRSPLALASFRNHFEVVQYLLYQGADIEAKDAFGSTPLLRAVRYGAIETCRILWNWGADPNVVDKNGQSMLHRAALNAKIPMFEMLASWRLALLDIDLLDGSNKTARDCLLDLKPSVEILEAFTKLYEYCRASSFESETELTDDEIFYSLESSVYEDIYNN